MAEPAASRIPVLIITDCEPDLRETTPGCAARWAGFERFFAFLSEQRAALAARTGAPAHFSWFWRMDRQIELTYGSLNWAARTYASQIAQAMDEGDEAGLHLHMWRWDDDLRRWIADHGNEAWVEECARRAFAAFAENFGVPCRLFRFGDGWHDDAAVELIERLGVKIDLTLEPGCDATASLVQDELSTGLIPDRRSVPKHPYRPSRTDFRRPDAEGDAKLWMLPVTTGVRPEPGHRRLGFWGKITSPNRPSIQLNLGIDPDLFGPIFRHAVVDGDRPYVAICVRSDVGSNEGLMACVRRNLQDIIDHKLADRFVFTGPSQALAALVD